MSNSTYKGYTLQDTGTNNGTWGSTLNTNALSYIDQNMGGITSVTLSGSDVVLSESQSRSAIIRLSGILLANVTVTVSNLTATGPNAYGGGFFFVENLTSGNYSVSVRNTNIATAATVPQGTRATLISDATNGVRIASEYNPAFATGTTLTFIQASAPTGWTKSTTHDNKALRIVSSSGGGSGGSTAFTSVFAARTISQANLPNVNLTAQPDGNHNHASLTAGGPLCYSEGAGSYSPVSVGGLPSHLFHEGSGHTTGTGTSYDLNGPVYIPYSGTHTHNVPLGGSGTSIDFAVQYVDAIICVKN